MHAKPTYEELEQRIKLLEDATANSKQAPLPLKQTKERLRQDEERYRNILDTMEENYYEVDLKGNYTFFNTAAMTNLGYTKDEMLSMNFRQCADKANARKASDACQIVLLTGASIKGFECELINKAGQRIQIETSIYLMRDTEGNPAGFRGILRDISSRKRAEAALRASEEKYRLLAETAADVIFTLDENMRFTYISPSVTRMRGFTVEEAMAQSPAEAVTPESLELAFNFFAEEMAKEADGSHDLQRICIMELEETCKDGSTVWTESIFNAIRDENNKYIGMLGITRDISERKQAEAERERLIAERQRAVSQLKILKGLLPICASCKKIRDDKGYWNQIETYIKFHSEADFSHSLCPDCANKLYPKFREKKQYD